MKEKFDENTDTLSRNLLVNVLDVSKMKSKLRQGRFDKFIYLFIPYKVIKTSNHYIIRNKHRVIVRLLFVREV